MKKYVLIFYKANNFPGTPTVACIQESECFS